jgi:hypothetical protein
MAAAVTLSESWRAAMNLGWPVRLAAVVIS